MPRARFMAMRSQPMTRASCRPFPKPLSRLRESTVQRAFACGVPMI
jgi:hypothetical protein